MWNLGQGHLESKRILWAFRQRNLPKQKPDKSDNTDSRIDILSGSSHMFQRAAQYNERSGCECDHSTIKGAIGNDSVDMKDQVRLSMAFEASKTPLKQEQAMRMAFDAQVHSSLR